MVPCSSLVVESALILIRHGESMWNEKNLFTGCVDVPLTKRGIEEAVEAGKRISNIPVDMIFTSALIRAQMTAMLAMTQHRRKKVHLLMFQNMLCYICGWTYLYFQILRVLFYCVTVDFLGQVSKSNVVICCFHSIPPVMLSWDKI